MRRLFIAFVLAGAVVRSAAAADIDHPQWSRLPEDRDVQRAWPQAATNTVEGHTAMRCQVTPKGTLEACVVLSENPIGLGFGQSALALASAFAVKLRTVNGVRESGTVLVKIRFQNPNHSNSYAGMEFVDPVWSAVPTPAEVAGAYPAAQRGGGVTAHVVLHCGVSDKGELSKCDVQSEEPKAQGFADAAKGLVPRFRLAPPDDRQAFIGGARVMVPFEFNDPAKTAPGPRLISRPRWVRTPDPGKVLELFPAKAAAAGVTTGRGTVDCVIDATGKLTQCAAIKEEPADLDFGLSAVTLASLLSISPWTADGAPAEGAHMRLPIRFNLHPDEPAPAQPAAPK